MNVGWADPASSAKPNIIERWNPLGFAVLSPTYLLLIGTAIKLATAFMMLGIFAFALLV